MAKEPKESLKLEQDPTEESGELSEETGAGPETAFAQTEVEPEAPPSAEDEIQRLKLQLDEYKDLFLRKAAEFENFKKRKQQEYASLIITATEALIIELLPVMDDLDRLLENTAAKENNSNTSESLQRGALLIRDKIMDLLQGRGLKAIESVGTPFDPELHEALMQEQNSGREPGIVLKEFTRGYRLGDKVIRHAQVVVSG
jgi:molecular chaperone GrpE